MKYLILLILPLIGCATNEQTLIKPSGEQVISSLFEASDYNLSSEPLCNMKPISPSKNPYRLKDYLSVILATSYESKNVTHIQTSCAASKHEKPNGQLMDIWDCRLTTNEKSPSGEFISASTIAFGLGKANLKLIQKSLRCF